MNINAFIPKQHPDLPEAYGMKIYFHGDPSPLELEVSTHRIIDKIYQPERQEENGAVAFRFVGVAPVPLLEYVTKKDIMGTVPLSSIRHLEFDMRWSKIRAIHTEAEKGKK